MVSFYFLGGRPSSRMSFRPCRGRIWVTLLVVGVVWQLQHAPLPTVAAAAGWVSIPIPAARSWSASARQPQQQSPTFRPSRGCGQLLLVAAEREERMVPLPSSSIVAPLLLRNGRWNGGGEATVTTTTTNLPTTPQQQQTNNRTSIPKDDRRRRSLPGSSTVRPNLVDADVATADCAMLQPLFTDDCHSPIYFFDGVCNFCHESVNLCYDLDGDRVLRFASLQSRTGQAVLRRFGRSSDDLSSLILLTSPDTAYFDSDAALQILQRLSGVPAPVRRAAKVAQVVLPPSWRNVVYHVLSDHRHLWGTADGPTCRVDLDPSRFVDCVVSSTTNSYDNDIVGDDDRNDFSTV